MVQNKSLIFKAVHEGPTQAGRDIAVEGTDFDLDQELPESAILLQILYASFDPFMRGRMRAKTVYPAYHLNAPITSTCVAVVLKSTHPSFPIAAHLRGTLPISQYTLLTPSQIASSPDLAIISNPYDFDPSIFLSTLGMPGLAAYSSLLDIGQPKAGETIFVSTAAGAVGQSVGQLAKHLGLRVIGSTGSDAKCAFLRDTLGFDGAFNYKTTPAAEALPALAPAGIDIYYDSVGGAQLDAALLSLRQNGRIVACGMMSQYNKSPDERHGIKNLMQVVIKRLSMRGFIVSDAGMGPKYEREFVDTTSAWIREGKWVTRTSVTEGVDKAAEGFVSMLEGGNLGKAVLRL